MKAKLIVVASVLAAIICGAAPLPAKINWHPKLVYRHIGGGYWLAKELGRTDQTFFLCGPTKTDCIGTKEIGWRKPFIIIRSGAVLTRSYDVIDTTSLKHRESAKYLESVPRYPAAVAWDKLSPTKPLW